MSKFTTTPTTTTAIAKGIVELIGSDAAEEIMDLLIGGMINADEGKMDTMKPYQIKRVEMLSLLTEDLEVAIGESNE